MGTLFLMDQLRTSFSRSSQNTDRAQSEWPPLHKYAVLANVLMIALMLFASYTTSVYFHTPFEKLTGFLLGIAGFAVTQLPAFQPAPEAAVISNKESPTLAEEKVESAKSR